MALHHHPCLASSHRRLVLCELLPRAVEAEAARQALPETEWRIDKSFLFMDAPSSGIAGIAFYIKGPFRNVVSEQRLKVDCF